MYNVSLCLSYSCIQSLIWQSTMLGLLGLFNGCILKDFVSDLRLMSLLLTKVASIA